MWSSPPDAVLRSGLNSRPAQALRTRTRGYLGCLLLSLFTMVACFGTGDSRTGQPPRPAASPILLFGVDGLEWDIVLPMLRQGRLPNMAALMERGYYGELATLTPTYSPVIWTTIATGKGHQKHGIHHFARRGSDGRLALHNSTDRRTKAIWNIVSDSGRSVAAVGWWMTFPVEQINGTMVAQTNTLDQIDTRAARHIWKGTLLKGVLGQVHPAERQNEVLEILEEVEGELPDLEIEIFGAFSYPPAELGRRLWENCRWAFRADATYLRIALRLAAQGPVPDLTLVYFGGPDVVAHRFWRYMQPELYRHPPTQEQVANFGDVIESYYAYTDRALGQLLTAYGPDVTIFVISDHGMRPVNLGARFDPDDPPADVNSAEHQDAPPGVFIAAGPHIRHLAASKPGQSLEREDLEVVGNALDITPTILAMLRIPIGSDMEGWLLPGLVDESFQMDPTLPTISTHDTPEFLSARGKGAPDIAQEERLRQLRSLGYIDDGEN